MIDKIEAMIEPNVHFRGDLHTFDWGLRDNPFCTSVRPSKYYHAVADLRPFGHDAMLHYQQKRYKTHKVELFETGKKGMAEIHSILEKIVDCDPGDCRLGRVDLAADVRDVSLSWFRDHTWVQYKQFLCAHAKMVEDEMTEMGKKIYQTLYFGKRPSCLRLYDKVAERVSYFELWKRRQTRAAKKAWEEVVTNHRNSDAEPPPLVLPEFPTVQEWLAAELPQVKADIVLPVASDGSVRFPVLTRIENQYGGRVPENLATVGEMRRNILEFNPFRNMRLIGSSRPPPSLFDRATDGQYRFSVKDWMAYMFCHQNWNQLGGSQMRSMLNRDRHGNKYLAQMGEFLPVEESSEVGITADQLYENFRGSIQKQLAA